MAEIILQLGLAVAVAAFGGALVSVLDYLARSRRGIKIQLGPVAMELNPGNVSKSLDRLESAARELEQHPRVFLSYAASDQEFARQLLEDLERQGILVWFDERELAVGDKVSTKLADAMNASQWIVPVLTPEAAESKSFKTELMMALREESRRGRPLILPALHRGEGPPPELSATSRSSATADRIYADFRSDYRAGLASLLHGIHREPTALARKIDSPSASRY